MNLLPDIPTVAESGFPGFDMVDWNGLFAATGTPREAIDKLAAAAAVSAKAPVVSPSQRAQGTIQAISRGQRGSEPSPRKVEYL